MPRYKLIIAYDGTDFCGWQKQEPRDPASLPAGSSPGAALNQKLVVGRTRNEGEDFDRLQLRTVQHVVEEAVVAVVREPVTLVGASRTDSGVHARGQVAAFSCEPRNEGELGAATEGATGSAATSEDIDGPDARGDRGPAATPEAAAQVDTGADTDTKQKPRTGWPLARGPQRLLRAINGRLPDDVQVLACEAVPHDFDPIKGVESKGYSYTLHVAPPPPIGDGLRPLFDRRYVQHIWADLNVEAMAAAAQRLVGEHDFAAFAAAGHGRLSTVRTIHALSVTELPPVAEGRRVRIDVSGSGFLWNMVRIIAGTLVEVGKGRMSAADIDKALTSGDRRDAGPTLPPTGLCLEWIRYG